MSIQSTTELTREDAIDRAISKRVDENRQKELLAKFAMMSDTELEDYLESTFDNYRIVLPFIYYLYEKMKRYRKELYWFYAIMILYIVFLVVFE